MELNLKDLGATLVTGAYFLFGLFSVLCLIFGWNFFFFINLARRVSSAGLTILTLSIAFGAGMLLEDLSNKFVDSGAARVPILDCQLLPHDEDLRAETLFGMKFIAAQGRVIDGSSRAAGLGRQAAEMGILADYGPEGAAAQQAVSSKQPNATAEQLTKAASRLYYDA